MEPGQNVSKWMVGLLWMFYKAVRLVLDTSNGNNHTVRPRTIKVRTAEFFGLSATCFAS